MDIGSHDNVTFIEKYFRNYIDKRKRLWLRIGNAKPIYNYFIQMQIENSSFFYMIDVEDKALIKNLLWTDTKSKVAYEEFSDVVTFDTINLTNKYDCHFHLLWTCTDNWFVCGLLSNEDTTTFTLLFQTW